MRGSPEHEGGKMSRSSNVSRELSGLMCAVLLVLGCSVVLGVLGHWWHVPQLVTTLCGGLLGWKVAVWQRTYLAMKRGMK
jgi:ribose/xylose/arabinose/galactoside ABC-type transport system permease subunit